MTASPTTPAASSPTERSTPPSGDSSGATGTASTTTSTTSLTRALKDADYSRLSPTSQATRILIGDALTEGFNQSELAERLGQPPSWVADRLQSLRNELLLQSGIFYPLSDAEYASLSLNIERNGVRSPVIVGEHIACVDGRHRMLIATELGLTDVPAIFLNGETAEAERELSIGLNAARRQLSRAQKRDLVSSELMRDPERSDNLIASICGVHFSTVGEIRREIEAQLVMIVQPTLEEPATVMPPTRVGKDGVRQPARAPRTEPASPATHPTTTHEPPHLPAGTPDVQGELVAYATCSHGERHAIWKHPTLAGRYWLENTHV